MKLIKIILILLFSIKTYAQEYKLKFVKSINKVFLYEGEVLLNEYRFVYGKNKGKKTRQGDKKSPEGIYKIKYTRDRKNLKKYYGNYKAYGELALVINYPNDLDREMKSTGGGIWIHGTDYPYRLQFDNTTSGCLVLHNNDIKDIGQRINYKQTLVVIEP